MLNSRKQEIGSGAMNTKEFVGGLSFSSRWLRGGTTREPHRLLAYRVEFWAHVSDEYDREKWGGRVLLDSYEWVLPAKKDSIPEDWHKR